MRLLFSTALALLISLIFFGIIKFWGLSQRYTAYNHPLTTGQTSPLVFKVLGPENITEGLKKEIAVYLNIAVTQDKKLIIINKNYELEKQAHQNKLIKFNNKNYADLISENTKSAVLLESYKNQLKDKKIIFNMQDNPLQSSTVFSEVIKNLGFEKGENFIFVSPYDPPVKDLKTFQPTYLLGTSDPEILKIKSMESLYLIEAAQFRADVVIHPFMFYKQPFFTEKLIKNINDRHKKIIIGPDDESEMAAALKLNPFGIIIN